MRRSSLSLAAVVLTAILASTGYVSAPPAAAASKATKLERKLKQTRSTLKRVTRERNRARLSYRRASTKYNTARATLGLRDNTVKSLTSQVSTLTTQTNTLQAENNGLRGSVPEQVAAVARRDNISELFNIVILPAYREWRCGGSLAYYSSFYSVDFDRRDSSGVCY